MCLTNAGLSGIMRRMPRRATTHLKSIGLVGNDKRQTSYRRGYGGTTWKKLRLVILTRDAFTCKVCQTYVGKSAHCDHIIPKAQGGSNELSNLQALCHRCHSIKTKSEGSFGRFAGGNNG